MRFRLVSALFVLTLWASQAIVASAQGPSTPSPQAIVFRPADEAAPISPAQSAGPLSLEECVDLGMQYQPALHAARASLSATYAGKRGVDKLRLAALFAKDLDIRRKQACQGVTIAEAALLQAEWETRYAITRNFFTVQYIRSQQVVVDDVLINLTKGYTKAKRIVDSGEAKVQISQNDVDAIKVALAGVRGKRAQVKNGMEKALAALREAMGVRYDYPLEIAAVALPQAVYEIRTPDPKAPKVSTKDKVEYVQLYKLDKDSLVASALANRSEIVQANAASRVTQLEIKAQLKIWGFSGRTFAQGSDIHVQPVPQGIMNGEYRPGAFAPEYPTLLAGRKRDREQRARFLDERMSAVVDKAENLVSLDVVAQYLKWQESVEDIQELKSVYDLAQALPGKVMQMPEENLTGVAVIQSNMTAIQVRTQLNEEMHIHALALAGLERATAGAFRIYPIPAPPK